ncbi:photosystem II assembly protein Psb35 [Leptothermofonsia sp. ETS-13]|uniref:photosystem II assembly protein Psb35 n=1 Tax=Leptothermofonsia sp. ETS-13 TaxID=3035696 RepID=UPI003B9FD1A8
MLNALIHFLAVIENVHKGPVISLGLIFVIGFIAAAGIGSIAWYNSKRPLGWEDKERPDIVPDID